MRVGNRNTQKRMPQVNLVPMMDVLMTVLTFFVILSMTLNGRQLGNIKLPGNVDLAKQKTKSVRVQPFLLGINADGELVHDSQVIKSSALVKAIQKYYAQKPNGQILLMADKDLDYSKVTQILKGLRSMGAQQVSLATQPFEPDN